ncbi:hypothetical protein [Nocardiopsis baichengensis]|uniref:hypothetical protein n=1 Tax=Nocardiopsis baichengensis TaxID=280240 RepID=UPI0003653223|nr:hypothetical protein [Nocardiopsis baichengensis]
MSKVRISISLESGQADRIRSHAERGGMDLSAYLVNAATRQMAETEAAEAEFAGIDALIADAEGRAGAHASAEVEDDSLPVDDRRAVDEAMGLVYGADEAAPRGRGGVA